MTSITTLSQLATSITTRRNELGYSQQRLADLSGVNRRTIIRFESGKYWVNLKQLIAICEAMGVQIELI